MPGIRAISAVSVALVFLTSTMGAQEIPPCPAPAPEALVQPMGEFTADGDTITIREEGGKLWLLAHGTSVAPLTLLGEESVIADADTIRFDPGFRSMRWRQIVYERIARSLGTFRIILQRPLDELRREAAGSSPPAASGDERSPDLVELASLDSTIRYDIRYATPNNFMGAPFYTQARALLQRPAAYALVRAHRWLARYGYGLMIHDAYRPWSVTKMFWDATPPAQRDFVANPARGSKHNRGCAVDVTLYDLRTGKPADMPSTYDEFSDRAVADYPGGTSLERWHRALLRTAMEQEAFRNERVEWWHFDHADWRRYGLLNIPFEALP